MHITHTRVACMYENTGAFAGSTVPGDHAKYTVVTAGDKQSELIPLSDEQRIHTLLTTEFKLNKDVVVPKLPSKEPPIALDIGAMR
jgi:hypothetical protein